MRTADLLSSSSLLPEDIWINRLLLTSNNATLASTSSDGVLRIFDPTTLQLVARFDTLHNGVTCLKPSDADPAWLVTAGQDAMVRCWDSRTGKAAMELGNGTFSKNKFPIDRKKGLNLHREQNTVHFSQCSRQQYSRRDRTGKYSSCRFDLVGTVAYYIRSPKSV